MSQPPADSPTMLALLELVAKFTGSLLAIVLFVWGIARVIFRPFIDSSRFESWKRKAPEAERFMRDTMFKEDIESRRATKALAEQGLQLASMTAASVASLTNEITRVFQQQAAGQTLLSSIPHLAGSMEQMSSTLERMGDQLNETNAIAKKNGETIAAHTAILNERGAGLPLDERRLSPPRRVVDRDDDDFTSHRQS